MSGQDVQAKPKRSARSLTAAAYWVQLLYIIWIVPFMIVVGYAVYDAFGFSDPGLAPSLTTQGLAGWLASIGLTLLVAFPNCVGAVLAARSRQRGGGRAATVALVENVVVGVALMARFAGF